MPKSELTDYVSYTPNKTAPRNQPVSKITIHQMNGVMSVEEFGAVISNESSKMSCNYAVGNDGRVGYYCEEEYRSWFSASPENDNQAITIMISNSTYSPDWPIADDVWNKLADLCVDICKRYGFRLTYTSDKNGTLTFNKMFTNEDCPIPCLERDAQFLCNYVNMFLDGKSVNYRITPEAVLSTTAKVNVKIGDLVMVNNDAIYWNRSRVPDWVKSMHWYIEDLKFNRAILGNSEDGKHTIHSAIDTKYLKLINGKPTAVPVNKQVKILANTRVYDNSLTIVTNRILTTKLYYISEEIIKDGKTFGKLKTGMGWVNLSDKDTTNNVKVGDMVRILNNRRYDESIFKQSQEAYKIIAINGDKISISADGTFITTDINIKNIAKI